MPISCGSSGTSGMGASSSSSDASAMAHSTRSSGAGSSSMCLEKSSSRAWSAAASSTASLVWASLWARKRRQPVVHTWFLSQRSVTARAVHSAEWLGPPRFVHDQAFEGASEDGTGKSGARLRLDAALVAAEDGHAKLQVRRASWREKAQYDVWESDFHGGHGGCWPCPREGSTIVLLCMGSSRRPMWPRAARASWCAPTIIGKYHTKAKEHSKLSHNTTPHERRITEKTETDGVCAEHMRKSWEE